MRRVVIATIGAGVVVCAVGSCSSVQPVAEPLTGAEALVVRASDERGTTTVLRKRWIEQRRRAAAPIALARLKGTSEVGGPREWGAVDETTEPVREAEFPWELGTYRVERVRDVSAPPWSAVGRLLSDAGQCTAAAIDDHVYVTAARCVYDADARRFHGDLLFEPQHDETGAPYAFGWSAVWIHPRWAVHRDPAFDFAVVRTDRSMASFLDHLGLLHDGEPGALAPWTIASYPGNAPFVVGALHRTTGSYAGGTALVRMDNPNATEGSTGAPWIVARDDGFFVAGILTGRWADAEAGDLVSPHLGSSFDRLVECAIDDAPDCPL